MAITNGYCTLQEVKDELRVESFDSVDDTVLERIIEDVSRRIDGHCARQFFVSGSAARYYSVPEDGARELWLDDDLYGLTSITNGDGAAVASGQYYLWPRNAAAKAAIILTEAGSTAWEPDASGNTEAVIAVSGSWGYVDRSGTDARALRIVGATRRAAVLWAVDEYKNRFGAASQVTTVTAARALLSQAGVPAAVANILEPYRRLHGS